MPLASREHQSQITDEIALAYLADRDADCPRCNYSLRDATTRTCPECGCHFGLRVTDPQTPDDFQRLIRFGLFMMLLLALLEVATKVFAIFQLFIFGGMGMTTLGMFGYRLIGTAITWTVFFLIVLRLWIKSRTCNMKRRAITAPAISILVLYTIPAAIDIVRLILL